MRILKYPLVETGHEEAPDLNTAQVEKELKHGPKLPADSNTFKWNSRSLFNPNIKGRHEPGWGGQYLIYKCWNPEAGLPKNEHFEYADNACAYGDVFIFRPTGYDRLKRATYGTFPNGFLKGCEPCELAAAIIYTLSVLPYEEEEKKKKKKKEKKKHRDAAGK